jgi:hypothetical protein
VIPTSRSMLPISSSGSNKFGTECSAICNNKQVYFHGGVTPGGAWVVDSNEVLGAAGDEAHDCLMGRFRDLIARELGCRDVST